MTIPICGNCKYWHTQYADDGTGECRRHPPQMLLRARKGDELEWQDVWEKTYWPHTDDHEWCGEWEKKREQE